MSGVCFRVNALSARDLAKRLVEQSINAKQSGRMGHAVRQRP